VLLEIGDEFSKVLNSYLGLIAGSPCPEDWIKKFLWPSILDVAQSWSWYTPLPTGRCFSRKSRR